MWQFAEPVTAGTAAAGAAGPGGAPSADAVQRAAEEIVARREFREQAPSLLERFFAWLGRQLGRLPAPDAPGTLPATGGRGMSGWLTVVLLVLAVVVLAVVARSIRRNGWPGRRHRPSGTDDVEIQDTRPLREDELAALAARHEAAGEWAEAVRARYRWAVTALRRADAVGAAAGRTPGELRREVAETVPALSTTFGTLTDTFESAWYAGQVAGPEDGAAARDLAAVVVADASTRRVEPDGVGP